MSSEVRRYDTSDGDADVMPLSMKSDCGQHAASCWTHRWRVVVGPAPDFAMSALTNA